jgi:hypothetical protein
MNWLHDHLGIIFAVDEFNTGTKRGTVTFVNINKIKGMLTAYHVYKELINNETRIYCDINEQPITLPEPKYYSEELDYVWYPLDLFRNLKTDSVKFFKTRYHKRIFERIKEEYDNKDPNKNAAKPSFFIISGSPNFACSHDPIKRLQTFRFQTFHVQFRQFEQIYGKSTQMSLEIDVKDIQTLNEREEPIFVNCFKSDDLFSAMGGYSGGPACAFARDGIFLSGIIGERFLLDTFFKIIVTPLTEIINDINEKNKITN